jgi:hypothetical protein
MQNVIEEAKQSPSQFSGSADEISNQFAKESSPQPVPPPTTPLETYQSSMLHSTIYDLPAPLKSLFPAYSPSVNATFMAIDQSTISCKKAIDGIKADKFETKRETYYHKREQNNDICRVNRQSRLSSRDHFLKSDKKELNDQYPFKLNPEDSDHLNSASMPNVTRPILISYQAPPSVSYSAWDNPRSQVSDQFLPSKRFRTSSSYNNGNSSFPLQTGKNKLTINHSNDKSIGKTKGKCKLVVTLPSNDPEYLLRAVANIPSSKCILETKRNCSAKGKASLLILSSKEDGTQLEADLIEKNKNGSAELSITKSDKTKFYKSSKKTVHIRTISDTTFLEKIEWAFQYGFPNQIIIPESTQHSQNKKFFFVKFACDAEALKAIKDHTKSNFIATDSIKKRTYEPSAKTEKN